MRVNLQRESLDEPDAKAEQDTHTIHQNSSSLSNKTASKNEPRMEIETDEDEDVSRLQGNNTEKLDSNREEEDSMKPSNTVKERLSSLSPEQLTKMKLILQREFDLEMQFKVQEIETIEERIREVERLLEKMHKFCWSYSILLELTFIATIP
jgi:hypothetical protein